MTRFKIGNYTKQLFVVITFISFYGAMMYGLRGIVFDEWYSQGFQAGINQCINK